MASLNLDRYRQLVSSQAIIEFDNIADVRRAMVELHDEVADVFTTGPELSPDGQMARIRSKSSILTLTSNRAILVATYSDNYVYDYDLCHRYISEKMRLVFEGIQDTFDSPFRFLALMTETKTSFKGIDRDLRQEFSQTLLKPDYSSGMYDALVRVSFSRDERYFINLEANIYQELIYIPVAPLGGGDVEVIVRLNDMHQADEGLRTVLDVNTKQDAFKRLPDYDVDDLESFLSVANEAMKRSLPAFLEGRVPV